MLTPNGEKEDRIGAGGDLRIPISRRTDIREAKKKVARMAEDLGLSHKVKDATLALTELCTNILKYSERGVVIAGPPGGSDPVLGGEADQPGLEVTVQDSGPGISDVQRAFTDGFSGSDSRGLGLGKVNQAVDELNVSSGPEGTEITFRVWKRRSRKERQPTASPLDFGIVTRKHPGMDVNGDAFIHKSWGDRALVGVIDGVGHGEAAHEAAIKATEYIGRHYDMPLESIARGTNRACRGSRGVVAGLVRFHWTPESVEVGYLGVGNIECQIVDPEGRHNLISKRGLLGKNCPSLKVLEEEWSRDSEKAMIVQSDGLKTNWSLDEFAGLTKSSASQIADQLLAELARSNDDATVAAIKLSPGDAPDEE